MCGIFGVFQHEDAANLTYLGLYALQHRGQESVGIVVSDGKDLVARRGMGLVTDVFDEDSLKDLRRVIPAAFVPFALARLMVPT